ncbi:MAG: RagB/SusD family nutrient uptake outer membrane protein [Bacteroidales bacterium]|nr:RagB/SusD family nutrient uptake outer membrane protein [Bacteroidales bacterium]
MRKIILILASVLWLSACSDKFLDIENKNNLDAGLFFTSENDLLLAVNAAYTPLAQWGLYGQTIMLRVNTLDPYIWFENPNGGLDKMLITTELNTTWDDLYRGLFRTSDILANMDKVKSMMTAEKYAQYEAQLKALRGMYYFYLVTWYNAPIYYDETNEPSNPLVQLSNGTPEQFWSAIEADLTYAANNLPNAWPSTETGRITKGGANALLGKALLYKHYHYYLRFNKSQSEAAANLTKAKAALKRVMDSGDYNLIQPLDKNSKKHINAALMSNSSYLDIPVGTYSYKAENNKESVWEVQFNDDDRASNPYLPGWASGGSMNYQYTSPRGYQNLEFDLTFWDECKKGESSFPAGYANDPRLYAACFLDGDTLDWRPESGYNIPFKSGVHSKNIVLKNSLYKGNPALIPSVSLGVKKYNYPQFVGKSSPAAAPYNIRVIRYADVLLMYAEACYQIDNDADGNGLVALNQVRDRVAMPLLTELTPEVLKHERTVEFAGEGLEFNDLVRWSFDPKFGIDLAKSFNGSFVKGKNEYFPIPQAEIDVNRGSLKQNAGW